MDLKKQIQKLQSELVEANQQSLYQQQQHEQYLQSNNDRMQANYDQQIEEVSRSKQEGWQAEMKRMQAEYEYQLSAKNDIILRLQNANTSVAQLDEKVLFGTDERKAVIQDVYSSVCTYFDPDGDERDTIQYSTNDVLRRIRSALKSMI
jgi:ribosomal protein L6P/L9E